MQRSRKILLAKIATVFSVIPALIYANIDGAPPRSTGAPGDGTCANAGCHVGTAVNGGGGNVQVTYSGGASYTPGQAGTFTVTITDSAAQAYGFQASARLVSNLNGGQAGTFTAAQGSRVECEDGRALPCRDTAPVQFITHASRSTSREFTFSWTPPATNVGDVRIYVAGNAANRNDQPTGDRIYTANLTLTPAAGGGNAPAISDGGIVDAFTRQTAIASGTWIEIYGQNLAPTQRDWTGAIVNGVLPTTLEGVTVTINHQPAPISFISSGQVNALVPADSSTGNVQVVVRTAAGESTPRTINKTAIAPAVYAPFKQGDRSFVSLVDNATGAIYGKPGVETRAQRAVRPGDVVQLYALGLGPTNPALVTDRVPSASQLVNAPTVRFGDVPAEVLGSALVGPGLYQINLRAPAAPDGDLPFTLTIGGVSTPNNVYITVQR